MKLSIYHHLHTPQPQISSQVCLECKKLIVKHT